MVSSSIAVLSLLVVALLTAGIIVSIKVRREQPRARPVVRVRHVLGPVFLVATIVLLGVTPIAGMTFDLTYQVATSPTAERDAIPIGESATQTIEVPVQPLPGTTYVVRGEGVAVNSWQREASMVIVTVTIPPSQQSGTFTATLHLTPYPAILPSNMLEVLHDRSPLAAMFGSAVVLLIPPFLLTRLLIDGDRPLFRTRNRWLWRRLGDWP